MRLLEYQAKEILSSWGISIPRGALVTKPTELPSGVKRVGKYPVVLKAQVYAGGRGKAGGIVKVRSFSQANKVTKDLLARRLVTAQTSPRGVPVKALLVEQNLTVLQEFYVSILLDRVLGVPIVVSSAQGGISIEELAKEDPKAIHKTPFDPFLGLLAYQARSIVKGLLIPAEHRQKAADQLIDLVRGFLLSDASLVEINPWALTKKWGMVALDAKMTLDDNGSFRQEGWAKFKTADADSPMEAKSRTLGISYVGLDGYVGCMVNGAGLAMATMDLIKLHGGEPANFLDVGGGADVTQVREAFKLIVADPKVKAVLVNIFGGIMKCDVIAQGILEATRAVKIKVPLVVRLEGTNVEQGRKILEESGLRIITATGMDEAARKVVLAAAGEPVRNHS